MKALLRDLCPPLLWRGLRRIKAGAPPTQAPVKRRGAGGRAAPAGNGAAQDLDVYWDPRMAEILEHWGEGNAWNEIQLLLMNCRGRVLDMACGTGKTMSLLASFPALEVHGCDISDMLIGKAQERGIARDRLTVTDATAMHYADACFDWGYSIGSLEHFTEDGISKFLQECCRVVRGATFHMVPVSRKGGDEGWIKTLQSYHNNSASWWEAKCRAVYPQVRVLGSSWSDRISVGKWLICSQQASPAAARAQPAA
jgi:ubiquinone/menaquinone biosynthesis C-methylase UbiE